VATPYHDSSSHTHTHAYVCACMSLCVRVCVSIRHIPGSATSALFVCMTHTLPRTHTPTCMCVRVCRVRVCRVYIRHVEGNTTSLLFHTPHRRRWRDTRQNTTHRHGGSYFENQSKCTRAMRHLFFRRLL